MAEICGNKSAHGDVCALKKRHAGRHAGERVVIPKEDGLVAKVNWQWSRHRTCHILMDKPERGLTAYQIRALDHMAHGCALSAARYNYKAQEMRDMEDLVQRGLALRRGGVPWNRAGAFVKP